MVINQHYLYTASRIKDLVSALCGYVVLFRINISHQIQSEFIELLLPVNEIIDPVICPVVINNGIYIVKHSYRI